MVIDKSAKTPITPDECIFTIGYKLSQNKNALFYIRKERKNSNVESKKLGFAVHRYWQLRYTTFVKNDV